MSDLGQTMLFYQLRNQQNEVARKREDEQSALATFAQAGTDIQKTREKPIARQEAAIGAQAQIGREDFTREDEQAAEQMLQQSGDAAKMSRDQFNQGEIGDRAALNYNLQQWLSNQGRAGRLDVAQIQGRNRRDVARIGATDKPIRPQNTDLGFAITTAQRELQAALGANRDVNGRFFDPSDAIRVEIAQEKLDRLQRGLSSPDVPWEDPVVVESRRRLEEANALGLAGPPDPDQLLGGPQGIQPQPGVQPQQGEGGYTDLEEEFRRITGGAPTR